MGLLDIFKKKEDTSNCMNFDDKLRMYVTEIKGINFITEGKKAACYIEKLNNIADNYHNALDNIIEFILPDLKAIYGEVHKELVKEKIGKPTIDYDNGTVQYLEQSFDDSHIFEFEFLDDEFKNIQYFSIDG